MEFAETINAAKVFTVKVEQILEAAAPRGTPIAGREKASPARHAGNIIDRTFSDGFALLARSPVSLKHFSPPFSGVGRVIRPLLTPTSEGGAEQRIRQAFVEIRALSARAGDRLSAGRGISSWVSMCFRRAGSGTLKKKSGFAACLALPSKP
ncbi:hypothetical protein IYW40_04640 [Methylocystis sp. H4A]|uniref:hypothetical protein n=1 Tax=Methylocystis sp. H4A TaxID=2785788 RepID=UPI0018C1FC8F|nr:hypothetical protein [Methylocystis sp. H4A]MBG0800781.1 hypothetical protein [Methylocystis sp. H4A]